MKLIDLHLDLSLKESFWDKKKIINKFEEFEVSPYCWNNFYSEVVILFGAFLISNLFNLLTKYNL